MEIAINQKFEALYFTKCRYVLSYGGRASGKSRSIGEFFILKALDKQFFRGVMMREVLGDIRQSQFQEIKDIMEEWGVDHLFDIRENTMEFQCRRTGNKIISKGFKKSSGNQTAKVKSIKDPTHIWIEEGDEVSEDDFIKADTSVRTTKGDIMIIITFNPEDEDHWIRRKFFNSDRKDVLIIHSTFRDNIENLQDSYVQALLRLKEEDPYFYDVFVEGLWGAKKVENPFAGQYKKSKHETEHAVFDPRKQLLISIDFNLNPFGVIFAHMWRDQHGEHLHVFEEESIEKGSVPAMIDLIKLKFGAQLPNCVITGDAMGKRGELSQRDNASNYEQLRRGLGLSDRQLWLPANPFHDNSRADCNYLLYHFNDFKINPTKASNTCRDLRTVQCDAFGEIIKKNRNDLSQRADHLDCFRYLINTFMKKWIDNHMKIRK